MSASSDPLILRIDFADLDYFGHVNNVSFFRYIQSSRVHYWEQIGLRQYHKDTNMGPMLASASCDFKRPLFFPGQVKIHAKVTRIGTTSFSLEHRLIDDFEQCVAIGKDVMVMFDFNTDQKIPFPAEFRKKIEALEGSVF